MTFGFVDPLYYIQQGITLINFNYVFAAIYEIFLNGFIPHWVESSMYVFFHVLHKVLFHYPLSNFSKSTGTLR